MFIVSRYLVACHSPYLFSGEGVIVRYISYCDAYHSPYLFSGEGVIVRYISYCDAYYSPDLFSREGLLVRYKPYCNVLDCMVASNYFGWFCTGWQWFHCCVLLFWTCITALSLCWVDISGAELFFLLFFLGSAGFKEQRKDFAFEIG